jgi:Flp pilus assembly protein TadD
LGSALLVLGRTKEAIVELQAAAERRKTSGAWNSLGWACAISQRMEEARDAFVKAIESDPTDLEPQRNLAALFEFLGMAVEAEATYDLILLSVPGDLEATQGKARCQARDTKGEGEIPSMVGARG